MFYRAILFGYNDERNNGDQGVLVRSVLLKAFEGFPNILKKSEYQNK